MPTARATPAARLLLPLALLALSAEAAGDNPAGNHPAANHLESRQQQLRQLQQRIAAARRALQRAEGEKDHLQTALKQAETDISRSNRRLRELRRDYAARQQQSRALAAEAETAAARLGEARRGLAQAVRAAWRLGRHGRARILLGRQDPALFSRMLAYYGYLGRQRARQIRRVRDSMQTLAATRRDLRQQTQTLERLRERRSLEQTRLRRSRGQKQAALGRITADIERQSGQLRRMQKDETALSGVWRALSARLTEPHAGAEAAFAALRGRLAWPAAGRLLARGRLGRAGAGRAGVVIAARRGAPVTAVARGRVVFADWLRGYGLLLILDHGDDYMSLYGHNESVYIDTGARVEVGEVIAAVGDSGGQAQTGLYFAIRKDGKPLDPLRWCAERPVGDGVG